MRDYLDLLRRDLRNDRIPEPRHAWGRDGILASWGRSPTEADLIAENILLLETAVGSLAAASEDVAILGELSLVLSKVKDGDDAPVYGAVSREIGSMADLLARGEYLEDLRIQQWRLRAVELGGSFPRSFFELASPSSPKPDAPSWREYWRKRNVLHMAGQEFEYFQCLEGKLWTVLFLANFRLSERFEKDEIQIEAWTTLPDDPETRN